MSQLGFGEVVVIALIALIVLGPERLPGAARTAGALLRRLRNSWAGVRSEIERELAAEEVKQRLAQAKRDLDIGHHLDSVADEIKGVAPPPANPDAAGDLKRSEGGDERR